MIKDREQILQALSRNFGSACIKSVIFLYLDSYGTDYDFLEFYVQTDGLGIPASVILRYNQLIYIAADESGGTEELAAFVCGFTDCTVISDVSVMSDGDEIFIMSKLGDASDNISENVYMTDDIKSVSDVVCKGLSKEKQTDFFLNTAHQHRHRGLSLYACFLGDKPVSVAGVTAVHGGCSYISFVAADEYFRGNGYSREVLKSVCNNSEVEYLLMCESENRRFYEKCGFRLTNKCYKYIL
ncbi:MAG: GNAT family N-acetyltransferase [Ruminococcus sp.]